MTDFFEPDPKFIHIGTRTYNKTNMILLQYISSSLKGDLLLVKGNL